MPISAPTVGLSFGSFGDIVAVLQLAWELRAALDESAGASAELRALVGDVDSFTRALQDVQANVERRRRHLRPDVVNGVAAALSRCRNVLGVIQQRIAQARGQTSSSGWQKYWGTTAWSILGGKKDVEALRARLSEQLGIMQLYLSLSEANGQEYVQDILMANSTTLKHIYTVVQDIQLRFDVGVPGFRFYDCLSNEYYLPLARTSLQRLGEVYEAMRDPDDLGDMYSFLGKHCGISKDDFEHRTELSTPAMLLLNLSTENGYIIRTQYFFFREAAFGEWQVLVGSNNLNPRQCNSLKILLERKHTVGSNCNCDMPCAVRYRGCFEHAAHVHDVCKLYSEAVTLLFQRLQPASLDISWLGDSLFKCPDPEQLRATVLPALREQPLSRDEMVSLVSETPVSPKAMEGVSIMFWKGSVITIPTRGATLEALLVGHAVSPFRTTTHEIRIPSWASFDYTDDCADWEKRLIIKAEATESGTMGSSGGSE